jgi:hypothetical protein
VLSSRTGSASAAKTYEAIGKPGGKEFRCQLTFNYLQGGTVVLPENLTIETCFYDDGKQGYDCAKVYTIGFELGLS